MRLAKLFSILGAALAIAGCHGRSLHVHSVMPPPVMATVKRGPLFVPEAEAALVRSDFAASVSFAELAVRAQPDDPRPRTLLAQAYLGGGRVVAAEQT